MTKGMCGETVALHTQHDQRRGRYHPISQKAFDYFTRKMQQ
jgi:hypothetical protein